MSMAMMRGSLTFVSCGAGAFQVVEGRGDEGIVGHSQADVVVGGDVGVAFTGDKVLGHEVVEEEGDCGGGASDSGRYLVGQ